MRGPVERFFDVGVFDRPISRSGNRIKPTAYTTWFDEKWHGCCLHSVEAFSAEQAKRVAIQEHLDRCSHSGVVK